MEIALLLTLCSFSGGLVVLAQTSLTDNDRKELLDAHNHFRRIVSPSASNMIKLEWNTQLEAIAQKYAQNCNFNHNANRHSEPSEYDSVGENLYATGGAIDYRAAVEAWYNEVIEIGYEFQNTRCSGPDPTACLHYTQVVWADSEAVGCGVYKCNSVTDLSFDDAVLLVCNYGPSGNVNIDSTPPYLIGESCSKCPNTHPFCERKLCTTTEGRQSSPKPASPETASPETDAPTEATDSNNVNPDDEVESVDINTPVSENESDLTKTKSKKQSKSKSRGKTKGRGRSRGIRKSGRSQVLAAAPAQAQQTGGKRKSKQTASKQSEQSRDNLSMEEIINLLSSILTYALANN